jgi:hypothetical protein
MKSITTERFRKLYRDLSEISRKQAREAYKQFIQNPQHPSLHFKQVHAGKSVYSARINKNYRVLGVLTGDEIVWFWIGTQMST